MPNKLKNIFSDDTFIIDGNLRFKDDEAYQNFLSALEIAHAEGRVVPVDGVTSISTAVNHQGAKFPLEEHTNISHFVVGPAIEPIAIPVSVGSEEKTVTLWRSQTKDKVILRSAPDSIVSFHFTFLLGENRHTVNYKVQFEKAKTIEDVADSFSLASALLAYLYKHEDSTPAAKDAVSLSDVKKYFRCYASFFRRLQAIENELGLSISPSLLNELPREEQQDIDELYLLLCEKRVIRLNAKLTSTDSTSIDMNNNSTALSVGNRIALTFISTIEFTFLKQTVLLHTANLIVNALVKEIQENCDGTVKILYGDTDSSPMYIAFSAFKTTEDAKQEADSILQHDDVYVNALTSKVYTKQFYFEK